MEVVLSSVQMLMAAQVGCFIQVNAIKNKYQDRIPNQKRRLQWDNNIVGQMGEYAVCIALNRTYRGDIQSFRGADVDDFIQVRSSANPQMSLTLYEMDNPDHLYVLVVGDAPNLIVVGSMWGHEAKQDKYWRESGVLRPAFFVPQADLKPFDPKDDRFTRKPDLAHAKMN
jgi:hypothetical protein